MTDLSAWVGVLLRRWYWLVAGTLVGLVGSLLWSSVSGPSFVSCASLEVTPVLTSPVPGDAPIRRFVNMDNELAVAESSSILADAARRARMPIERRALTARVSANSEVLNMCLRAASSATAQRGLQGVVDAYRASRATAITEDLDVRVRAIQRERDRVAADVAASVAAGEDSLAGAQRLQELSARIISLSDVRDPGSRTIEAATLGVVDGQGERLVLTSGIALGFLFALPVAARGWSPPVSSPRLNPGQGRGTDSHPGTKAPRTSVSALRSVGSSHSSSRPAR